MATLTAPVLEGAARWRDSVPWRRWDIGRQGRRHAGSRGPGGAPPHTAGRQAPSPRHTGPTLARRPQP
ncbi:MAG: hypothetical protein AMXMBFR64_01500 [Myxococcales bacterium]